LLITELVGQIETGTLASRLQAKGRARVRHEPVNQAIDV
jgi:hypothetical protein